MTGRDIFIEYLIHIKGDDESKYEGERLEMIVSPFTLLTGIALDPAIKAGEDMESDLYGKTMVGFFDKLIEDNFNIEKVDIA